MKTRIIKRTYPNKTIKFVIQQKHWHWLLRMFWADACLNNCIADECQDTFVQGNNDTFDTIEDARKNLCYFDGTKTKDEVMDIY